MLDILDTDYMLSLNLSIYKLKYNEILQKKLYGQIVFIEVYWSEPQIY